MFMQGNPWMPAFTVCPSEELVMSSFVPHLTEDGLERLRRALEREVNLVSILEAYKRNMEVRQMSPF